MNVREVDWVNGPMPVIEPSYLARIFAATSDIAFLVRGDGTIMSVLIEKGSDHHREFMHWGGRRMQDHLTSESVPKFERALAGVGKDGEQSRRIELNHTDGAAWEFPVRYSFHAVGPGKSILMLGHDLRFEAEMQEQLIQAQVSLEREFEQRRAGDAHYRVVLGATSEPFFLLSAADGRVRDLNVAAADAFSRLREDLIGAQIAELVETDGALPPAYALATAAANDEELTLRTLRGGHELRVAPVVYRATGERMIFCRVVSGGVAPEAPGDLARDLEALYRKGPEAIAFCTAEGRITGTNDAFLELVDVSRQAEAVDRSLADFLHRGEIDLGVILRQVRQSGRITIYSTRMTGALGARTLVNLSATCLDEAGERLGFVFRDAEKTDVIRRAISPGPSGAAPSQSAVDLVGSATLKEIVADANEVIERMCIEAALELTRGNRAAAAETLGVSRQSLYVKLRKYGLSDRADDGEG